PPQPWGCGGCLLFTLTARPAWLISRCGQPPAKRRFGHLVPFCAPMMPIVGPRSKASLRPTRWPLLFGRSWLCAAHGQEGLRIFCAPVLPQAKRCHTEPQDGQEIHAPSLAGCVAARRSSGPSAFILPLVAKAERAAG